MGTVDLEIDADERHDPSSDADFALAHLSDLHLSSLDGVSPRALLDKRILGYISWRLRRRHEHRTDVLDALRADLQAEQLDHIAVTGDLTHLGLPQEFREAATWLARLGRPEGITVVPGNHDAYVPRIVAARRSRNGRPTCRETMPARPPTPTMRFRACAYGAKSALIGLSTARPSAPFLATGRLGERQLSRLDRILEQTAGAGLFRVVLLHHPPAAHTVRWRKSLLDGAALRDVLAGRGAELVLHGHAHFSAADVSRRGARPESRDRRALGIGDRRQGRSACDLPRVPDSARRIRLAAARVGARLFARSRALRSRRRPAPASGACGGAGLSRRRPS